MTRSIAASDVRDELRECTDRIDSLSDDQDSIQSSLTDLTTELDEISETATELEQDLNDGISDLDERVNNISDYAAETRQYSNENTASIVGDDTHTGLIDDVSMIEDRLGQWQIYTIGTGAVAVLSLLMAVLAILI